MSHFTVLARFLSPSPLLKLQNWLTLLLHASIILCMLGLRGQGRPPLPYNMRAPFSFVRYHPPPLLCLGLHEVFLRVVGNRNEDESMDLSVMYTSSMLRMSCPTFSHNQSPFIFFFLQFLAIGKGEKHCR